MSSYLVTVGEAGNGLSTVRLARRDQDSITHLDSFRTRSGARHAIALLESGAAVLKPHAPLGCRVQALPSAPSGYATDGTRGGAFLKPY